MAAVIELEPMSIKLPPKPALLDSNVLVGYFHSQDQHHVISSLIIETMDNGWIVLQAVLVEAWGILHRRDSYVAHEMLRQVANPGRFFFLDTEPFNLSICQEIVSRHRVDVADAIVTNIAAYLSEAARPQRIPIFTCDVSDYTRIVRGGVVYDVYNQEELLL